MFNLASKGVTVLVVVGFPIIITILTVIELV
jgi:hypothetical protein